MNWKIIYKNCFEIGIYGIIGNYRGYKFTPCSNFGGFILERVYLDIRSVEINWFKFEKSLASEHVPSSRKFFPLFFCPILSFFRTKVNNYGPKLNRTVGNVAVE